MMIFPPLPRRKYDVVVADPPWHYHNGSLGVEKFYRTMRDGQLLAFPMREVMHNKSVLFLWATSPRLDFAIHCLAEWGLCYRGVAFVWVKTRLDGTPVGSQGVRPSIIKPVTEYVLAASIVEKGRPMPLSDEGVCQTIFEPRTQHSCKPDEVMRRIERLYPTASRIELFARRRTPGWDSWGDELPSDEQCWLGL